MNDRGNYFRASKKYPYHLSIGAVVLNGENKILCHHFESLTLNGATFKDFYILMRETIEPHESIEQCLMRGLKEEFGVKARIEALLGSISSKIDDDRSVIKQKTVVYFLCKYESDLPEGRLMNDPESISKLEWQSADFLINKMKEQGGRLNRPDIDESSIIERIV